MAQEIIIEGITETKYNLSIIEQKVNAFILNAINEIAQKGAEEARRQITQMKAVDTGALKASIEGGISKADVGNVEGFVSAGSDKIVRGQGNYTVSRHVTTIIPTPTSKYAESVEEGTGPNSIYGARRFMGSTFQYLKDLTPRQLMSAIRRAIERI